MSVMKAKLLAGIAALLTATSAARAHPDTLPEMMLGNWCFVSNDQNSSLQKFFERRKGCSAYNMLIIASNRLDQEGGMCAFDKIEQSAPNAYLVHLSDCKDSEDKPEDNAGGSRIFELISSSKLMITFAPES
jgi:hypothetical protein